MIKRSLLKLAAVCLGVALATPLLQPLFAQDKPTNTTDWPQWRGPNRDAHSADTGLLKEWPTDGPKVIWEVDTVGVGYSSVIVAGDRLYTQGDLDGVEHLICLSAADGKVIWAVQPDPVKTLLEQRIKKEVENGKSEEEVKKRSGGYRNGMGDGPRGTPTLENGRLYVEGGNGDVSCHDAKTGKTLWYVSLTKDFGGGVPGWGYSESPLIEKEMVIVTPGGRKGTVVALDKMTGKTIWRSEQVTQSAHYSSPVAADIHGTRQIVQFASSTVFGLEASSGKLLWSYARANNTTANCSTPLVYNNHVFAASAYSTGGGLAKIIKGGEVDPAEKSNNTEQVYFERSMENHHGGMVKVGDHLYGFGRGGLIAMDYMKGTIAWTNRSVGKGSLIYADGMLYCLGENHAMALVEATPEAYKEKGRFKIANLGKPSWAHPTVAGGRLYLRNQGRLTVYDVKGK